MKISKIELVENRVNASINAQIELKPEPKVAEQIPIDQQAPVLPATPTTPSTPAAPAKPNQKEAKKVKDDAAESSIVTADYIQQSMISHRIKQFSS